MAGGAGSGGRGDMHSRQRKPCGAVVECSRRPTYRRVASGTVCYGKCGSGCGVGWGVGLLPGRQMAAGVSAIGRGDRQSVVVIDVAQIAGHGGMRIGEREAGRTVIKNSRRPGGDRVTGRTS